jgi:putative two-component system response regulator
MGDEQFVFLSPKMDAEKTPGLATRLSQRLERMNQTGGELFMGVAGYPSDGTAFGKLLNVAREHLEQSRLIDAEPHFSFSPPKAAAGDAVSRVLIVDDDPQNRKLLRSCLSETDRHIVEATNGTDALSLSEENEFDLVLLDVMMPGLDGFEVCRRLKTTEASHTLPVILITALDDTESRVKGIQAGAEDFISKPFNIEEVSARAASLIRLKKIQGRMSALEDVLEALANAVEAKDTYTKGHTDRVSRLATLLGERMGLSPEELEGLRVGGILHDVGKIGVPESILNKEGPLTEGEWAIMQTHPLIGVSICSSLSSTLGYALDIIRHHHERLDGSSYPDGLRGEEISMVARVMAVVDTYDALTSDRPYRQGMRHDAAIAILREDVVNGKLDGSIVDAFVNLAQTAEVVE